jgi:serine/threonine protein kinase/Tfp pilus assembly protein PilF
MNPLLASRSARGGVGVFSADLIGATSILSEVEVRDLAQHSLLMDRAYDEYLRLREAGEPVDAESFCQRYPALRKSLLKLLAAHRFYEENPDYIAPSDAPVWPRAGHEFMGYGLEAELGRGAFARVFRARERAVGDRLVVVKVALRGAAEAATLGRLRHDNVVPVLSVHLDPASGFTMVCMPYQGPATLARVLDHFPDPPPRHAHYLLDAARDDRHPAPEGVPPPHRRLVRGGYVEAVGHVGVQMADALAKVHALGILHCDLKPSNVLLSPDGRPLLLDFNLAFDPNVPDHRLGGTLPYMAPEQLRAIDPERRGDPRRVEARSDLYALGVILFELLTGAHPFGKVPAKLSDARVYLRDAQQRGPRSLRQLNPSVGRPLARLIESCLAAEPEGRPASAAELAAGLREALTPWAVRAWRTSRRAVVAASLLVAVSGAGAAVQQYATMPSPVQQLLQAGQKQLEAGREDEAVASFGKVIQADPELRAAYFLRARAHHRMRNFEAAVADFNAGDPDHNDPVACAYRGFYYSWSRDHTAALTQHLKVVQMSPMPTAEAWNNLAYSYLMVPVTEKGKQRLQRQESNNVEAKDCLERALALDGSLIPARYNRAALEARVALNKGICPKVAIDELGSLLGRGQYPAAEYFRAATTCAKAADVCPPEERPNFGRLAHDYALLAIQGGHGRKVVVNDSTLTNWVIDLRNVEDPVNNQGQGRLISIGLADPLQGW